MPTFALEPLQPFSGTQLPLRPKVSQNACKGPLNGNVFLCDIFTRVVRDGERCRRSSRRCERDVGERSRRWFTRGGEADGESGIIGGAI